MDEAALLRACAAAPEDDAPRLVLADGLLERGDPWGELLALSCRLAREGGTAEERARQAALERALGPGIGAGVGGLASRFELRRGLVGAVWMDGATFAREGARLLAEHPIEELHLSPLDGAGLARLARAPALARLSTLVLSHGDVEHERLLALAPFAESADLAGLRALDLSWFCTVASDWREALAALRAPRLASLRLDWGAVSASALTGLAENPGPRVEALSLSHATHLGRKPWVASPSPGDLADPDEVVAEAFERLGHAEAFRALSRVSLEAWEAPSARDLGAWLAAPNAAALASLDLSLTRLDGAALAGARLGGLRRLDVSGCALGPEVAAPLLALPALASLRFLGASPETRRALAERAPARPARLRLILE